MTYPIILIRKLVNYVLNINKSERLNSSFSGKNTYYGYVQINNLYPAYLGNGSFVQYEFKPEIVPLFQAIPINRNPVSETISYNIYNPVTDFTTYFNDTYISSYDETLPKGTYTSNVSTTTSSTLNSQTTNRTYTYVFSTSFFIVRGKECYVFENDFNPGKDVFLIGRGEIRVVDNLPI